MKLYIANKNYSSWSFRPWIAMKVKGVAFEEELIPFDDEASSPLFKQISPNGKVPALHDGKLVISESLAILEYLADRFPEKDFWPSDINDRARARAAASEMHSGFGFLRSECPMNMRREIRAINVSEGVHKDVARIEAMWDECLQCSGGPFLFGDFCNADAMYAPVVNRLEVYALSSSPVVATYSNTVKALPAWQEWQQAGIAEPWVVPADEA